MHDNQTLHSVKVISLRFSRPHLNEDIWFTVIRCRQDGPIIRHDEVPDEPELGRDRGRAQRQIVVQQHTAADLLLLLLLRPDEQVPVARAEELARLDLVPESQLLQGTGRTLGQGDPDEVVREVLAKLLGLSLEYRHELLAGVLVELGELGVFRRLLVALDDCFQLTKEK